MPERAPASGSFVPPGRDHQRAAHDPLQHAIDAVLPWIRGERGLYAHR